VLRRLWCHQVRSGDTDPSGTAAPLAMIIILSVVLLLLAMLFVPTVLPLFLGRHVVPLSIGPAPGCRTASSVAVWSGCPTSGGPAVGGRAVGST
jgi:hypothetical protein